MKTCDNWESNKLCDYDEKFRKVITKTCKYCGDQYDLCEDCSKHADPLYCSKQCEKDDYGDED